MSLHDGSPPSLALLDPALEAVLRLAHLAAQLAGPDTVLPALVRAAVRQLGADAAAALRLDQTLTAEVVVAEGEELMGWRGEAETVDRTLGERLERACRRRYPQVHTVPLVSDADVFGALVLFFDRTSPLDEKSLRTARGLADLAASALAKAARYEALERALRERDHAQQRLRSTVDQLQALIDTAGSVIVFLSPQARVLEFNRAAEIAFGRLREEVLGHDYFELISPANRDELRARFHRVLAGSGDHDFESDIQAGDGSVRTLLWNANRVVGDRGETVGVVAVGQDITDRKRLQTELLHAQKMEAVGRLASGIAHDFNNVLMGITGAADVALHMLAAEHEAREFVHEIKEAGMRGAALTKQLKTFARRKKAAARPTDLNRHLEGSQRLLRQLLPKNVELCFELTASDSRVLIDPGQLEQMLLNLAINACDAMPRGGVLTVGTIDGTRAGAACTGLSVADTGQGMSESVRQRIFEPFFTTKDEDRGTGLGLAMVHSIVTQSGGHIDVETALGKGTKFVLWLPRTDRAVESAAAGAPPVAHQELVLLVEDDPLVLLSMRHWLDDAGFRVLTAENGPAGLALFEQHREAIDALVSDLRLPEMSGYELARCVRNVRPDMPLVFVSAHAELIGAEDELPGAHMLSKPFRREALLGALSGAIPGRAQHRRTLLVVDDDASTRRAIRLLLGDRYEILEAEGVEQAVAHLEAANVDVLLTDVVLPGTPLTSLIGKLHAPGPRVIYMSGYGLEDEPVSSAMRLKPGRFVPKPIDVATLEGVIESALSS